MKLHAKVILLLIALFAAYGAIDYAVQQRIILPSFTTLEADLARTDMRRVSHALEGEVKQLQVLCANWGNWLDAYRFVHKQYDKFVEENLGITLIQGANLQLIAFLDTDSHFVWSKGYNTDLSERHFKLLETRTLGGDSLFREAITQGKAVHGIVQTEHGPAIIAIAPVLNGAGGGPHAGAVLIGRLITPQWISRLAAQAEIRLQVISPARRTLAGNSVPTAISMVTREKVNEVYRNVLDVSGQPVLTFRVDVPRSITERGEEAIYFALASLLIAGAGMLFVLVWALRRMILRPVSQMTRHALSIGDSDDLTLRLEVDRSDELGLLAREFNRMLRRTADARRRLVDKSFEAGIAEMARGALHNIGNALTPIAVKTASVQDTLSQIPAADMQMVLNELEQGAPDRARKADLQEFLRLASTESLSSNARIAAEVKGIADSVQAIQAMLNDRAQFARSGPVVEAVKLDDVVRQALLLVPPQRLSAVDVTIDETVSMLGTVLLARIALQQVFQNLILNASEAMRSGVAGQIKVFACATGPDGDRKLQVSFSDNGSGIAPEHLTSIFNKGFSTKPLENNSGLGLHWSANVVASLGGNIHVESPGRNGGADFHVTLPLQKTAYEFGVMAA